MAARRWLVPVAALAASVLFAPVGAAARSSAPNAAVAAASTAASFPHAVDSQDTLTRVDCPTVARCVALGITTSDIFIAVRTHLYRHIEEPVVQTFTAATGKWTPTVLAGPVGARYRGTAEIACVATTTCTAVATYETGAHHLPGIMAATLVGATWRVATVPLPVGGISAQTTGLTCVSATACVLIGEFADASGLTLPFASMLSGSRWTTSVLPTPRVDDTLAPANLEAVSCADSRHCEAFGQYSTSDAAPTSPQGFLAESYVDGRWAATTPDVAGDQNSFGWLDCSSTGACFGTDGMERIRYSAGAWTDDGALPALQYTQFQAGPVECPGGHTCRLVVRDNVLDVVTVGRLSGGTWVSTRFERGSDGQPPTVTDLSCVDGEHCAVVGYPSGYVGPWASRLIHDDDWGTTDVREANSDVSLDAVSCPRIGWCAGLGFAASRPYAWIRDGSRQSWTWLPLPPELGHGVYAQDVEGIACPAAGWCVVVGHYSDGGDALFADTLTAGRWESRRLAPDDDAHLPLGDVLAGVSCPRVGRCFALGDLGSIGDPRSYVFRLLGGSWTKHRLPGGVRAGSISCADVLHCLAVSRYADDHFDFPAAQGNGVSWRATSVRGPDAPGHVTSVSCVTSTECVAAGRIEIISGADDQQSNAFASVLADGRWSAATLPGGTSRPRTVDPYDQSIIGEPVTVSCNKPESCWVVGRNLTAPSTAARYLVKLTSKGWDHVLSPAPSGTFNPGWTSVSCVPGSRCTAVGYVNELDSTSPAVATLP